MTDILIFILLAVPGTVTALSLILRRGRVAEFLNLAGATVVLAAAIPLPALAMEKTREWWQGYLFLDPLGAWVVLCTAVVYFLASMYAVGYMRMLNQEHRLHWFYALLSAFAMTMLAAPLMNNIGIYWIAVELTTLVSTFLVGFEHERESIEAAWKYIIVVSAGISLALLATVVLYWAGTFTLGASYDMTWSVMRDAAAKMNPTLVNLAFLLALIGYGTKAGLAPMHTWLPDAHSEGPAPVSAMLSGALLNTAMLGIVRFLNISDAAGRGLVPHTMLVALGVFSLLVAALFITRQTGIKRLMAYSSVEHIGVMAIGFGFGGPLGIAGALYHMLNHSLNKSVMFFGAGNVLRAFGTKKIGKISHVWHRLPVVGTLWLLGAVAITGAPPFGLFLSEITIMRSGLSGTNGWAVFVMALLLIVIFVGFLQHFIRMYFGDRRQAIRGDTARQTISVWCVTPMWLGLAPVLILGLWWPAAIWNFFMVVARHLGGGL